MVEGPAPGIHGKQAMISRSNSISDYAVVAVSLGLAAVFIYAGVEKMGDALQFADSIAAFGILPAAFISLLALSLPPFETRRCVARHYGGKQKSARSVPGVGPVLARTLLAELPELVDQSARDRQAGGPSSADLQQRNDARTANHLGRTRHCARRALYADHGRD